MPVRRYSASVGVKGDGCQGVRGNVLPATLTPRAQRVLTRDLSTLSSITHRHAARERAAVYCGKISRSAKRMNPSWSGPIWWI